MNNYIPLTCYQDLPIGIGSVIVKNTLFNTLQIYVILPLHFDDYIWLVFLIFLNLYSVTPREPSIYKDLC